MYAVITGGSRGIGKALAYEFASKGYDLILTCEKNYQMLIDISNDIINKFNRKVLIKQGLLTESDIDGFEKNYGVDIRNNIFVLINNAGKCDYNTIGDIDDKKYKDLVLTNIDYTFYTTKLISKYLIKNKHGVIINITSMWGILGSSCEVAYSMTKGALISFTKALSKELKESTVSVVAFALGAVDTDMCREFCDPISLKAFTDTLDNKRMFQPSEIAEMVYYRISNNNFNSGDIIELNNGLK